MKILYLKGYRWLLSQNQQVRNDFSGYRGYEALAKHIKPFFTKHLSERTSVPRLIFFIMISFTPHMHMAPHFLLKTKIL